MTSHDVVVAVRRITGQRRAGHAGTLDPMAEGVLVVGLGQGTRVLEYLLAGGKEYCARSVAGECYLLRFGSYEFGDRFSRFFYKRKDIFLAKNPLFQKTPIDFFDGSQDSP